MVCMGETTFLMYMEGKIMLDAMALMLFCAHVCMGKTALYKSHTGKHIFCKVQDANTNHAESAHAIVQSRGAEHSCLEGFL